MDEKYTLDPRYVKAIKQVVDWALEENMYVILCGPASHLIEEAKEKVENDVHYSACYVSSDYKKQSGHHRSGHLRIQGLSRQD